MVYSVRTTPCHTSGKNCFHVKVLKDTTKVIALMDALEVESEGSHTQDALKEK